MNKVFQITAIDNTSIYKNDRVSLPTLYSTREKAEMALQVNEYEDAQKYYHPSDAPYQEYKVKKVEVF